MPAPGDAHRARDAQSVAPGRELRRGGAPQRPGCGAGDPSMRRNAGRWSPQVIAAVAAEAGPAAGHPESPIGGSAPAWRRAAR